MKIKFKIQSAMRFILVAYLFIFASHVALAEPTQSLQSPSQFVQQFFTNFYADYLKYMNSKTRNMNNFKKLFEPRNYFSDTMSAYLLDDERVQLANPNDETGLDFDPFVDAQDEVGKPIVGDAKVMGEKVQVGVTFSMFPKHQVSYELTNGPKGFVISNIFYPENKTDLMKLFSILNKKSPSARTPLSISGEYKRYVGGKADKDSATIKISEPKDGRVHVEGNAVWVGNAETGDVNTGELDGEFRIDGNRINYSDGPDSDSCKLTITFVNEMLTVTGDNMKCGGLNVTFNGEYRR